MNHGIARVEAWALAVPVDFSEIGADRTQANSMLLCEIETASGVVGHGVTSITQAPVVATAINRVAAPEITGMDALCHDRIWHALFWTLSPWGQTGYASHAIAAIDVALWDLKGKLLGQPVWRLLGGARDRVEAYVTCGFAFLDRDQLAEAMRRMLERGFRSVKMQVGRPGLDTRRSETPLGDIIAEDVRRVASVREAIGPDAELAIDAGCRLDLEAAVRLARAVEDYDVACFEEPISQNDVRLMAQFRRRTTMPLAAGQNEGLAYRFRDMALAEAVDILQPNVIITGGFTQCLKIAGLAEAFNLRISNGGGCPWHNMHLQAGVRNGTTVEYQVNSAGACRAFFTGLPEPENGWIEMPEAPGLGFAPDMDAVRELTVAS